MTAGRPKRHSASFRRVLVLVYGTVILFALLITGIYTVVSPQIVAGNLVTRYVRALHNSAGNSQIQTLYKLVGGKVEAAEFIVPEDAGYLNIPFKELELMPNLLIGCIIRNGKIIFPGGDDVMKANDSVIVVTAGRIIEDLHDIFM